MKQLSRLLLIMVVGLFITATSAYAQEATPTPAPATVRRRQAEKRAETQAKIQAQRLEVRTKVSEVHGRRLSHRFGVYYQRLNNVIGRMQVRLTALKDQGKDTTAAEEELADAESMLTSAQAKADTAVNAFLSEPTEDQRQAALAARDVANEARAEFMAVFQLLKDVLQTMKAL